MNNEKDFKDFPEGWKWVRLGEVIEYEQPQKYIVSTENYEDKSGIPVLTAGKTFILGYTSENFGIYDALPVILFDDFTTDAKFVNFPFKVKSSATKLLKAKDKNINLFYVFNTMQMIRVKPGSEHKRFWISEYSKLYIPLPPLPEQQKIAEILETIDNAIEKTDKIIEKYKRIKQGLMQDLLTKGIDENGNIRDEKTHKFKDSPLGRIPEEWEVVRLGEVGELRKEKALPPKNNIYIGLENIEKGTGKINGFIPSDEIKSISNIFKTGDILFGKLRPNLRKFWYAKYNGYCSTEFLVIFPSNEKIIKEFLYLVIGSNNFLKLAESKVFGTKMPRTSWDILKNYTFSLPPLPEQQRIAEILSQIDQTIKKEQQYKEKLQRIKQGLMQDLLTGKVRVNHLVEEKENEQRYTSNFTRT